LKNLQILVISLKQSLDRQAKATTELSKAPFEWAFLDAIDGRKLNYPIPEYLPKKVKRLLGFELTPNEIGCFLSHRKAWQSCLAQNLPTLVFEDDFVLMPHFEEVINTLISHPQDWELVRLQALLQSCDKTIKSYEHFQLVANHGDPLGATAYLMSPKAASILLKHAKDIYEPLDHFLEHHQKHSLPMLAIKPYPVDISKVESTIADRPNDRKPTKGWKKRLRSISRQIDRIFATEPWFPR
jgi:glycosyl transferase family 25